MLKFKTIQDFIKYRPKCLVCSSEMRCKLLSSKFKLEEDCRSTFKEDKIILQSQDENLKWYDMFEINILNNKITSSLKNEDLHKAFEVCKFAITSSCSNRDYCGGHWLTSYYLTLECKEIKIYQNMLAREEFHIKQIDNNDKIRETKLVSNYQMNKSQLSIHGMIDNHATKNDSFSYPPNYGVNYRALSRTVIKPYTTLPLINLSDFSSLEDVMNCIDTVLMFS